MSIASGHSLGAYSIVEEIGRGGMATVYKAFQPSLSRYVAVKVLPAFFAEDPTYLQRFRQEAVAIASLQHPNILPVHDFGEQDGVTYLVTALIDGGTLETKLGSHLSAEHALTLLRPLASALDYAHGQGIIHRDVKPSNVLLTRDGTPILADFGLAEIVGKLSGLTASGTTVGTLAYMAPEQATDGQVSAASDIYALAVILYEMLTGTVPYSADTPLALMLALTHDPLPPPRERNPEISPIVQAVLLKALDKEPTARYPSAQAMLAALDQAAAPPAATTNRPAPASSTMSCSAVLISAAKGRRKRPRVPVWLVAPLALAAGVGLFSFLGRPTPAPTAPPARLLYADDFSDPAKGLFLDHQSGTARSNFLSGDLISRTAQWDAAYRDGALVGHVGAPSPPFGPGNSRLGGTIAAANRFTGDFAIQAKAAATKSPKDAMYNLRFTLGGGSGLRDVRFGVLPSQRAYFAWEPEGSSSSIIPSGRNSAIALDGQTNLLRAELRGSTLRLLVNGQEVDKAQNDVLAARPATFGLSFQTIGAPADDVVEIRFTDFKVYSLGG